MKAADKQFFIDLLENQLEELRARAGHTVSGLLLDADSAADPIDRATQDSERNYMLRIRDRESKLINKIKSALQSIDDGTYGICESCGEDISIARLKARPVTAYCISCKTKMEANERATGS